MMQWFNVIFSWRVLLLTALIVAAVAFCFNLLDENRFSINHVNIEGDLTHISTQAIASRIAPLTQQSFFAVDIKAIKHAIAEVPWVDDVAITRKWPDSLQIHVQEKKALARYNQDALVDHHGHLFYTSVAVADENLPLLEGTVHRQRALWSKFQHWQDLLKQQGLAITQLSEPKTKSLTLKVNQGFDVILGQLDADRRLQRFVSVYRQLPTQVKENLLRVDLRYTKGMSIAFKDGFKPKEMIGHG